MTEDDLPNWVPVAVRKVAPNLDGSAPLKRRLLCDDRMKGVWRELRKRAPCDRDEVGRRLKPHEQILMKYLGLLNEDVSPADQACAAFIISVTRTIWNPSGTLVWTKAVAKEDAARWEDAATLCRWIASEPMFPQQHVAAKQMADFLQTHADSLKDPERACLANLDPQQIEPFRLDRSSRLRGDDKIRGYTRAIAADAHRIFGSYLYGTVATVVSVALQTEVTRKDVGNWSRLLIVPISTPPS
jgi:hypothetical protein